MMAFCVFAGAPGVVQPQPVPVAAREAGALRGDRAHHHAGLQLVQEPAAEGPRLGRHGVSSLIEQTFGE